MKTQLDQLESSARVSARDREEAPLTLAALSGLPDADA